MAMSYNCRQYPCKPVCLRLLEGCADEHKAGVAIFSGFRHVYRLTTAMRFDDPVLITILAKMCTPGGAKLAGAEWASVEATEARTAAEDKQNVKFGGAPEPTP